MALDLDRLQAFCISEIQRFAQAHEDETFYAFAFDGSLLCLNSEEQFAKTLKQCQETWDLQTLHVNRWDDLSEKDMREIHWLLDMAARLDGLDLKDTSACLAVINEERARRRSEGGRYRTVDEIQTLRQNTGDWAYQGFAQMTDGVGFDDHAYQQHYGMSDEDQKTSEYGIAMDALLGRLQLTGAFSCLRKSPDFCAIRVEHNY